MEFGRKIVFKDYVGCIFLLMLAAAGAQQQETYISHNCAAAGNYTSNSTYQANLKAVLAALPTNTDVTYGYYNLSEGNSSDKVSINALCRGDISLTACRSCLNYSSIEILRLCPIQKEAIVWYNRCMLMYSNRTISGFSIYPNYIRNATVQNFTTVPLFSERLNSLLNNLRDEASLGNSSIKFAVGYTDATNTVRTYALVQCTPNLSKLECTRCLDYLYGNIKTFAPGSTTGRGYCPSCNFRYQLRQFYDTPADLLELPPPQPPATNFPSPPVAPKAQDGKSTRNIVIIVASVICFVVLVLWILMVARLRIQKRKQPKIIREITPTNPLELDFETIRLATDSFSDENKLGQGGFGAVYKGTLEGGQEIAVKRLATESAQGDTEFKNEVMVVAKLQHPNLVKLIGFCLEGQEKLLVYEFMPNTSLDQFLFDSFKRAYLHWERRYAIIQGIAKGLVFLHEDSQLGIIHRDLKASNILLDKEMNPKIADFGMARLMFGKDQKGGETRRVVGTHAYMAPEYAIRGQYSEKSDVYSFGILVLEIVSGQKKSAFCIGGVAENLLNSAWESWSNDKVVDILDEMIKTGPMDEITRCVHIGLLCVQENPVARPNMASVVAMLHDSSLGLPNPVKPAVSVRSASNKKEMLTSEELNNFSENEVSLSEFYPR